MTDDRNSSFIPTGDADADAATLGEIHGVHPSHTRATMLRWLTELSYGQDGPNDTAAVACRPGAADMHDLLSELQDVAARITGLADENFAGMLQLACADMYGADGAHDQANSIRWIASLPEREAPLGLSGALSVLLATPIINDWRRYNSEATPPTDIRALVRDCLAGRWRCPADVLDAAVKAAEQAADPDCEA
jgi:hypothetical protein